MVDNYLSPLLRKVLCGGKVQTYKKGDAIYTTSRGDKVMLIDKGFVKRYMIKNDGSISTQIIYGPQDIFSFTNIYQYLIGQSIYGGPEAYYYKALCDTRIYSMDLSLFKAELDGQPWPYRELFSEVGYHLQYCIHSIENIGISTAYGRAAHQLLFFARAFGQKTAKGTRVVAPITHQDLADLLGLTRETVTLACVKLREHKIILPGRQIVITDIGKLSAAAYE